MLNVNLHLNGLKMGLDLSQNIDRAGSTYLVLSLKKDDPSECSSYVNLFVTPEQAEQIAKALLSQVQQIQEEEIYANKQ